MIQIIRTPNGIKVLGRLPTLYRHSRIWWWRKRRSKVYNGLLRLYVIIFTTLSMFPAFWIGLFVLWQASDSKSKGIGIFPAGLNDAAALMPLATAGFTALLFSAQQSVPTDSRRNRLYGIAGRRMVLGVYFFGLSFIDAVGSRIMHKGVFDKLPFSWLGNYLAELIPGLTYINGLIAFLIIANGLYHYVRTLRLRD